MTNDSFMSRIEKIRTFATIIAHPESYDLPLPSEGDWTLAQIIGHDPDGITRWHVRYYVCPDHGTLFAWVYASN